MELEPRDMHVLKIVAGNIRAARARRQWSQEELAHRAGIRHQSLVSELENGRSARLVTYARIARALEIDMVDLLEGVDER